MNTAVAIIVIVALVALVLWHFLMALSPEGDAGGEATTRSRHEKRYQKPNPLQKVKAPVKKSIGLVGFMLLLLVMSCCAYAKDARKVPGDHDYPVANQTATRYFVLNGDVDAAMKIRLSARWTARNPDCTVSINWLEGVRNPFYVDIPLKLTWSGTHYAALVYVDAMLPGRCDYSFKSVVVSGVDSQNQIMEMADWRHPAPNEKAYADPNVWADLIILTTDPLQQKDRTGVRNLICAPSYGDTYHPHVLRCGARLDRQGVPFDSLLWITPSTRQVEVNFHYP